MLTLEKKDLKVETQMSKTIFLDIETQIARTVFVDIRNTSDKEIDVKALLVGKLQEKGYVVTNTPNEAFYILQGSILYVGRLILLHFVNPSTVVMEVPWRVPWVGR